MLIINLLSVIATIALIAEIIFSLYFAPKELRKAYIVPSVLQLFSIFILIQQTSFFIPIIPEEIIKGFSYFFSLYLTYTAVITITNVDQKHHTIFSILWSTAAIIFWVTSIFA